MALGTPNNFVKFRQQICAIWTMMMMMVMLIIISVGGVSSSSNCGFDAIFSFGDSNSDTGSYLALFPPDSGPYRTRASDGKLIIDFLVEALGLPLLSPYLQSVGSDYSDGVNFALSGSTALLPSTYGVSTGVSPFALSVQLNQFKLFKSRVDNHIHSEEGLLDKLPPPDIFGRSLYTIYIGQNDLLGINSISRGVNASKEYLSNVVVQISETIKELYWLGGRAFMVFNLAPLGCYPYILAAGQPHSSAELDEFGCIASYNNAADYYNIMLKAAINQSRQALPDASIVHVDLHDVLLELFQHPTSHGFKHSTRACCGYGGGAYNYDSRVFCRATEVINGSIVTATPCADPQHYINWDGAHNTEAANKFVADAILTGTCTDDDLHFPIADDRHLLIQRSDPTK